MNARLLAWARALSGRQRQPPRVPPLWLFTDARRLPDPRPVVARLPKGLAGVVLRHDPDVAGSPDGGLTGGSAGTLGGTVGVTLERATLGRDLALLCRARRLALVVAADPRLAAALGAGMHLRGGRWPGGVPARPRRRRGALLTSSAHGVAELRRAAWAGVDLVFLSPAFATASHPGAAALGPLRWGRLARGAGLAVAALGGIDGASVRRLPRVMCRGAGAIEALMRAAF